VNDGQVLGRDELGDEPLAWPVTATRVLARGKVGTFAEDDITTPDGSTISREYIKHPGAVGVIALDDEGRVALVRQYRHPVRHRLLEPPAGLLDLAGESYLLAAQRELAEEVGLAAETWHVLVDLFTTPGLIGESLRIFLARDLSPADAPDGFLREGEEADMDCVWASLDDLVDVVLAGDGHNPTLVSGVLATYAARSRDGFATLRPGDSGWPAREAMLRALS
jgi:8-oxo-dGDP phosphatase